VNRGLFNWGVFLVAAGAVALAFRFGLLPATALGDIGRFWPLLLVALGIALIAGHVLGQHLSGTVFALVFGLIVGVFLGGGAGGFGCTAPREGQEVRGRAEGMLSSPATVNVRVACGELDVAGQPGDQWVVENSGDPGDARVATSGALTVTAANSRRFPIGNDDRDEPDWRVTLPQDPQMDLSVEMSAGTVRAALPLILTRLGATVNGGTLRADLREATVSSLSVTVNAGTAALELPRLGSLTGSATTNAGTFRICAARDLGLRLRTAGGAGSNNFEAFGLTRSGNVWESANFASATTKVELSVTVNAGTATLEESGGCA
jgi:hypothetical protein